MEPIKFPEANQHLQKPEGMTDEECGPLPVYNDGRQSISCWKLSLRERLYALLFGRVWLYVMFGHTQPPVALEATRTVFIKRKIRVSWSCSDSAHHEHSTKLSAWWCGRKQFLRSVLEKA